MNAQLAAKLESLPPSPGVYLMKDHQGTVVYVGKAVNLRSRVRSYFQPGTSDSRAFVGLLDELLGDLETVLTANEKEALLLENHLIKAHRPRFNVLLRDDKNFICLRLDTEHPYPRLEVVRRFTQDGARYFGPYSSATAIRETLRIINRYFGLRTCSDHALESRRRPCLLYQMGRCPAPCVYPISAEQYRSSVDAVALFLEGRETELVGRLRERMKAASEALEFEEAARLRDQVLAIERSLERQRIATVDPVDRDVFAFFREADRLLFYALFIRRGRVTGGQSFPFSGQEFPDAELLASFVSLYYDQGAFVPKEVLLAIEPEGLEGLSELLTERKGEKVRVLVPQRGEKLELVKIAARNAEAAFQERRRSREELDAILLRLQKRLELSRLPLRIECFDVSHFQGAEVVASQVAVTAGEPDKSRYRRFKVRNPGNDDFAAMHEVLLRRLKRGAAEGDLPDLIVIDGGKGQLASAQAAMKDLGLSGVDLVGLAKSRDLEVEDRDASSARSPERIFLPNRKDPIVLPQSSPELFMLTRIRDEAHRFAITFQQKLSRRRTLESELEEVPGVGEARKKALLRHFGSLKRIREASIEELAECDGLGPAVAERLHAHLHGQPEADDEVRDASVEDAVGD
ncbi:MAG: excinuclease ABC subunit UvrC [Myxococcaceae bacterium]